MFPVEPSHMDSPLLVLANARILTMDPARSTAGRLTVRGDFIAALDGTVPEGALVVDCRGGILLPGFVDPHVHLLAAAAAARSVDCSPRAVRSIREIQERIAATAAGSAGWVRAVGYDESALKEGRHPTRWDLDAAVPNRPVRLLHRSGHAAVLNSRALALAGIDIATEEPPGGVIDRRLDDGEPTGPLMDMDAVIDRVVPPLPRAELVAGMRAVGDVLLAAGVSAVQDLTHTNDAARIDLLERAWIEAGLTPRLLPPATRPNVAGDGPVKLMLGEAGGLSRAQTDALAAAVDTAHAAARQVAVHAITAEAVGAALDAIDAAARRTPRRDHRHRIEHAAVCPPPLAERAAALGVVVVSNPVFLWESGARYLRTVASDDLPHLYAAGDLADTGLTVAAASDTPVARPDPAIGAHAATTRRAATGERLPGNGMVPEPALALVTRHAAFAAFAERDHGVLAPGRRADLVLLDRLPGGETPPAVWWTILSGRLVFAGESAPHFPTSAPGPRPG